MFGLLNVKRFLNCNESYSKKSKRNSSSTWHISLKLATIWRSNMQHWFTGQSLTQITVIWCKHERSFTPFRVLKHYMVLKKWNPIKISKPHGSYVELSASFMTMKSINYMLDEKKPSSKLLHKIVNLRSEPRNFRREQYERKAGSQHKFMLHKDKEFTGNWITALKSLPKLRGSCHALYTE